jgi:hypothetical protein
MGCLKLVIIYLSGRINGFSMFWGTLLYYCSEIFNSAACDLSRNPENQINQEKIIVAFKFFWCDV